MDFDSAAEDLTEQPPLSDLDLLYAMREGQKSALRLLYDRYSRLVYSLAYRILNHAEEAEDLTQEIFLTIWHRDTYNPKRGSFSSFLTLLTRSRAIDRLRSRGTRTKFIQRWQGMIKGETSTSPLESASIQERSELIRQALSQISDSEREVIEIAYYEGLSQSEIAQRLNIPLGTVKTRSRQGLLKLRQVLQERV